MHGGILRNVLNGADNSKDTGSTSKEGNFSGRQVKRFRDDYFTL